MVSMSMLANEAKVVRTLVSVFLLLITRKQPVQVHEESVLSVAICPTDRSHRALGCNVGIV